MAVETQAPAPIESGPAVIFRDDPVVEYIKEGISLLPVKPKLKQGNTNRHSEWESFLAWNVGRTLPTHLGHKKVSRSVSNSVEADTLLAADTLTRHFLNDQIDLDPLRMTYALVVSAAIAEAVRFGTDDDRWKEFLIRTGAQILGTSVLRKGGNDWVYGKDWRKFRNPDKSKALCYRLDQVGEGTVLHQARTILGIKNIRKESPASVAVLDLSIEKDSDGLSPWQKEVVSDSMDAIAFTEFYYMSSRPPVLVFPGAKIDTVLKDPTHSDGAIVRHEYAHTQRNITRSIADGVILGRIFEEYKADFVSGSHSYQDCFKIINFMNRLGRFEETLMASMIRYNTFDNLVYGYTRDLGPRATILALSTHPQIYKMRSDNHIPGILTLGSSRIASLKDMIFMTANADRDCHF